MNEKVRGALTLLGFALIAGIAFFAARQWQAAQSDYERLAAEASCDLRAGACRQPVPGGSITFSIEPGEIPLMKSLTLWVETQGLAVAAVAVDIRGLNMDMGLNRTQLIQGKDGSWQGETILPICSHRRMEWEAAVQLDAQGRFEVPFAFHTNRP